MSAFVAALQLAALDIVNQAFERAGQDAANVRVKEVEPNHWALSRPGQDRTAAAMRTQGGGEWIVVNKNAFADTPAYRSLLQHEVAHLLAWRAHGERIREHGPQFNAFCRQVVEYKPHQYCERK